MSEALLATEQSQDQGATTQGAAANVDTQPAPEQQTQAEPQTTPEPEPKATESEPQKGEAKTESKPEGAPERYAFEVPKGMPEGFAMDEAVETALKDVSRELDLTQEKAQQFVDEVFPVMHRRAEERQTVEHDKWIAEVKADSEIGGQKLDENLATAKRAVQAYASDGMRELLDGPYGSHPEVVRFLVKVGRTVSEDQFVGSGQRGGAVDPDDTAAVANKLYPKSQQKA